MVLCDVVGRLVLGDLHTRAHVALPVEEEGEGARQALAGGRKTEHKQKTLEGHASVRPVTRQFGHLEPDFS